MSTLLQIGDRVEAFDDTNWWPGTITKDFGGSPVTMPTDYEVELDNHPRLERVRVHYTDVRRAT